MARGFLAGLLGIGASATVNPTDDRYWTDVNGTTTWAGNRVSPDGALRVSTVYACVSVLSKILASLPVEVCEIDQAGNLTQARWHPLQELLEEQPNDWQTGFDFKAYLMSHACLRGNGLAEIRSGVRGAVDSLWPIHTDRVFRLDRAPDGRLRYHVRNEDGVGHRVMLQDEVLHIRAPIAPGSGIWASSPIDYAVQTVGLALAAEEHGARTFANGARPSGVVQLKGVMGDDAFERFKAQMQDQFVGLQNAGKTLILENDGDFKPITMTAEQLQFIATRQFQIEEVARWFDVPLVMLHHLTGQSTWGTGVEAIMLAFVRNNLKPWLVAWEKAIRRDLIVAKGRFCVRFDIESLISGDSNAMSNFISRLVLNGVLTRNEGRAMIGFNPIKGLDEPLTPTNTTTSDAMPGNGQRDGTPGR